jgi:hypothetical protein
VERPLISLWAGPGSSALQQLEDGGAVCVRPLVGKQLLNSGRHERAHPTRKGPDGKVVAIGQGELVVVGRLAFGHHVS